MPHYAICDVDDEGDLTTIVVYEWSAKKPSFLTIVWWWFKEEDK